MSVNRIDRVEEFTDNGNESQSEDELVEEVQKEESIEDSQEDTVEESEELKDEKSEETPGEEALDVAEDESEVPKFHFEGREMTPQQLYEAAMNLKKDHTRAAQQAADREREISKLRTPDQAKSDKADLSKYTPEAIEAVKEIASALGFLSQDQLQAQQVRQKEETTLSDFFGKHPEYGTAQDPYGERFDTLKKHLSRYNTSDLENLSWALEQSHKDLVGGTDNDTEIAKKLATVTKIKRSGVYTVNTKPQKSSTSKYTPEQARVMERMGLNPNE